MERLSIEPGRVVLSRQGRDEGRYFVILEVVDEQFVMMADGLTRTLTPPKQKKLKHLYPQPVMVEGIVEGLNSHQLLDSDLRKALNAAGFGIDQPLCKEG